LHVYNYLRKHIIKIKQLLVKFKTEICILVHFGPAE